MKTTSPPGRLVLVPNTLDFGVESVLGLDAALPPLVWREAAQLRYWVVENAKSARAFLKRIDAVQPLSVPLQQLSIVELPRPNKGGKTAPSQTLASEVWASLLAPARAGHDLGLLSEAGLPAVADPGSGLVAQAHRERLPVHSLAGPSSLLLALAASGLQGQQFAFVGYLPQDAAARTARIRELEQRSRKEQQTQIAIETPYRNRVLLDALLQALHPETRLSVSMALTTPSASTHCATVAHWRREPRELPTDQPAVFSWLAG
ncbi:SAM-dependent methyltransferase [Inhella gelatinilytica]|uniref:SAM-dependent methyltransferase n=1 Tax=Inhella gelatinilytica TaxID=2795030 RepID=A0A931NB86_9BURK|nr:SAM-dependent methyltransferase [Inhella gelatinilytica]MBH9553308.1 SAM-dependent methyltransferase [Inhella gelatinilytica]